MSIMSDPIFVLLHDASDPIDSEVCFFNYFVPF